MIKTTLGETNIQDKGKVLVEYRLFGGPPPGINNCLAIYENGFSTYILRAPTYIKRDFRENESGYYEGKIDSKEAESFFKILKKAAIKIPKKTFVPDTVIAKYSCFEKEKDISFIVSHLEIPRKVWKKTRLIIQKLLEEPVWTINLEVYNIGDKDSIELKFIIKNRGKEPVQITNPWAKSKRNPKLTNFIIDALPKDALSNPDYFLTEEDNSIRWMIIQKQGEPEELEPFIWLAPEGEIIIQYTPKRLAEFCKNRKCIIEGRYEGEVRLQNDKSLMVSVYTKTIEIGASKGKK